MQEVSRQVTTAQQKHILHPVPADKVLQKAALYLPTLTER